MKEETTLRLFVTDALGDAGYVVDEVASADDALARIKADHRRYDAVVLDVRLLDQGTDSVIGTLRALDPGLPLLLTSEAHAEALVERFAGDGYAVVIGKPYNAARLKSALDVLRALTSVATH